MTSLFDTFYDSLGINNVDEKKYKINEAARAKASRLTTQDYDVINRAIETGVKTPDPLVQDIRNSTPLGLYLKYGNDAPNIIDNMQGADIRARVAGQQDRSIPAAIGDAINSLLTTGVSGLGGVAALGVGAVDPASGAALSEGLQTFQNDMQSAMSNKAQVARVNNAIDNQLSSNNNQAEYERSQKGFWDIAAREGKNFMDSIGNAVSDPTTFTDGLAGAAGSLFSGSVLGSIIRNGGNAVLKAAVAKGVLTQGSRAANLITKIGSKLTMPAAIAGTEAGSAYQQTAVEVLQMDHTKLLADSPEYADLIKSGMTPEDAKIEIANRAALMAAGIQAPVAALTGSLVGRIERNFFKNTVPLGAAVLREGGEETLQGISGTVAQNLGKQTYADNTQELSQGTGEQAGLGLLYGAGLGSVAGGPIAALNGTLKAGKITLDAGKAVLNAAAEGGRASINKIKSMAPASREAVTTAAVQAQESLPTVLEDTIKTIQESDVSEEAKVEAIDYANKIADSFNITPEDTDSLNKSENLSTQFDGVISKVDLINRIVDSFNDNSSLNETDKLRLGKILFDTVSEQANLIDNAPDVIANLPTSHPLNAVTAALVNVMNNNEALKALAAYSNLIEKESQNTKPINDNELSSPVAQEKADKLIAIAEAAPESINVEAANTMLRHAETGKIVLNPVQKKLIKAAVALAETAADFSKREADAGLKPRDFVSKEILTDQDGWEKGSTPSAKGHMRRIVTAMKNGNIDGAASALNDLRLFAQHMQNKVTALNTSIASDDWDGQSKVTYMGLTPARRWVRSEKGLWVNPNFPSSIQIAKQIGNEALALADLTNKIVDAFPELGIKHIDAVQLDSFMNGTTEDVQNRFKALQENNRPTAEETQAVDNTPEATPEPEVNDPVTKVNEALDKVEETQPEPKAEETKVQEPETKEQNAEPKVEAVTEPQLVEPEANTPLTTTFSEAYTNRNGANLTDSESPINDVADILNNSGSLRAALGTLTFAYDTDTADAYSEILGIAGKAVDRMVQRLNAFLNAPHSKKDSTKRIDKLKAGEPYAEYVTGKILNLTEQDSDGNVGYNSNLIQLATLAAMQWRLGEYRSKKPMNREDVADRLGIPEDEVSADLVNEMNSITLVDEAVSGIANKIAEYWGVTINRNVPTGISRGILEATAKEVIASLQDNGFLTIEPFNIGYGDKTRTFNKVIIDKDNVPEAVYSFPTALDKIISKSPEDVLYINEKPTKVMQTQINNAQVELTKDQKNVLDTENQQPFIADTHMLEFNEMLTEDGIVFLFGSGEVDPKLYNKNHAATLQGKNNTLLLGYELMKKTAMGIKSAAKELRKSVSDIPIYYTYGFNRVNRMQMNGRANPQSNKLLREVFLPTWSELDLTTDAHAEAFDLALGQAFGLKIHKMAIPDIRAQVADNIANKYSKTISILESWLKDKKPIPQADLDIIKSEIGSGHPELVLHALMEYARSKQSNGLLTTSLYLEADGITNGVINSLSIFNTGEFTPEWVENMQRGGVFYGRENMTMNDFATGEGAGKPDIYETLAGRLKGRLNALWQETNDISADKTASLEDKEQAANFASTLKLLDLFSADLNMTEDDIDVLRGITKNPMTQLTYQAGAKSIATRIASDFTNKLYERMTDMARAWNENPKLTPAEAMFGDYGPMADVKYEEFTSSWGFIFGSDFNVTNEQEALNFDIDKVKFNKYLIPSIAKNFSIPLMEEARTILGNSNTTVNDTIRVATQVQSIIYAYEFQKKVTERIEQKKAEGLRETSLSPKELDDIAKELKDLAALINTSKQNWLISKGKTNPQNDLVYSQTLDGKLQTTARMFLPADAGVSGVPNLTIGSGDGLMMQLLSAVRNVTNTLKVYDGVNLPLDKIKEYSLEANKAVLGSWNETQVIKAVLDSYAKLRANYDTGSIADEQLVKALADAVIHPGASRSRINPNEMRSIVRARLESLTKELDNINASTSKRYEVMRKVMVSVDQMAGGNTGYYRDGIDVSGSTSSETAAKLNALMQDTDTKEDKKAELTSFDEVGRVDRSGSTIISPTALNNLLKKLVAKKEITSDQEVIMRQIIRSGSAKDYTLVYGTPAQLIDHAINNDKSYPEGLTDENTRGLIDPSSKTIYYTVSSAETLLHELIHATTLDAVIAVYNGSETNPEIIQAVNNIKDLANQFLKMEPPIENIDAVENMKDTIRRERNNPTRSKALNEAIALNEFMAWVLANPDLANQAKSENVLTKMIKTVVDAIKRIVWGRKQAPKPLNDILSNLQFNTSVIIRSNSDIKSQFVESMLYHSENFGKDERLKRIEETLLGKFSNLLDEVDPKKLPKNYNDTERFSLKTKILLNALQGNGFDMTPQEASVFRLLVGALGTQIELDPASLNRVQELYNSILKDLKPESFMADPESNDPADIYMANAKYNMIVGKGAYFKDSTNRSTLLPMFLALANVSSEFRAVLRNMPVAKAKQASWDSVDNVLTNIGSIVMDKLQSTLSGEKGATEVGSAILNITDNMIDVAQDRKGFFEQLAGKGNELINRASDIIRDGMQNNAAKLIDKLNEREQVAESKYEKLAINTGTAILSAINQETAEAVAEGTISFLNRIKAPQFINDLANDLIGRTNENKNIYDLIKGSRTLVEQFRQKFREGVPAKINSMFKRELRKTEWSAMHTAMGKTDLAALNNILTDEDVIKALADDSFLDQTIADFEGKVKAEYGSDYALIEKKAQQLAEFMMTGKPGANLLRNAYAISQLWNEKPNKNRKAVIEAPTDNIDALVTLYALRLVPNNTKDIIVELANKEPDGMRFTYKYLVGQRTHEMKKSDYSLAKANGYKGYIPATTKQGHNLIVASDDPETVAALTLRGYTRLGDYKHGFVNSKLKSMGYYYTTNSGRAMFNQGITQNARDTAQGVDVASGASIHVPTAYRITDPAQINRATIQMMKSTDTPLMPVYSNDGEIIAFEASIDPEMSARVVKDDHMGKMLGVWRGRQAEEEAAKTINNKLIKHLYDMYHEDITASKSRISEYVNLYDDANLSPVVRDAVSLFTPQMRSLIASYFPEGQFLVRRDMVKDVLGYRSASIGDFWTGTNNVSPEANKRIVELAVSAFGPKAYEYATKAEKYWQNFVTDARVLIAVKSGIVPIANFISNFYHLFTRGVPLVDIVKKTPAKINEINSYIKTRVEQIELEAEIRAATDNPVKRRNLQARLKAIEDSHRRMSIWPLIEAGEFTSISDVDVSREELQLAEGKLADYIETLTNKLPSSVKTAARYAVITKDTALFKGMQRAVEYGDFIAKAIIYDDIVKRQGKSKEYALGRVTEEFVNYDRLSGRTRQALENNGLLWFYNFKIRSVKIGASMLRNNPLTALIGMNLPMPTTFGSVGTPITDNLFSIGAEGKLGWSIGPGMGIQSFGMHPWVNMTS